MERERGGERGREGESEGERVKEGVQGRVRSCVCLGVEGEK